MSAIVGERLVFGQHNGPNLELKVYGDEFYARYETLDGYTVVYDLDRGQYCYAILAEGRFASSGSPVAKPAPQGIPQGLKEPAAVRNEKFKHRYQTLRPQENSLSASSNVSRTFGPNSGLLWGRQLSTGNVRGLAILVEFQDKHTNITPEDVNALLNDPDYHQNGNFCSVRRYFDLMSSGKLTYTNKVVGPVRLSQKQSYYINNSLIPEALEMAVNDYDLDLSEFDALGNGRIEVLSFMYAGRTLYVGDLWPHNFYLDISINGYRTGYYTIQSLGRYRIDLSIGTFAHESGHMLCRFPDLYDYGEREGDFEQSSGLGQYCLMSSGNHLNGGKTPAPICAYLRDLAGWCDDLVNLNNPGTFEASHGKYDKLLRFSTEKSHEYFLMENRHRQGLDQYLPDAGLAIYHCDTRGSNEYEDGTPENHYQCALIQADGRFDLERTTRGGDEGDLYESKSGVALSHETLPDSQKWDRTPSGLIVSNVGPAAAIIGYQVGEAEDDTVTKTKVEDLIIPDDDPAGVQSVIPIQVAGTLVNIQVEVDISHTYRGDLKVRLLAPSGKAAVLHKKKADPVDNLHLSLDSQTFAALKKLKGEALAGEWTLHVADLWQDDVGRLNYWSLNITYQSQEETSVGQVAPMTPIPDNHTDGVQSSIDVAESGQVNSLKVEVEITHTYRGDLQLELMAPSGQRALLQSSSGGSGQDLYETYTETSTTSLKALSGEATKGLWTLHVRDLLPYDEGTLEKWALTIKRIP
jgi:M6 family metalloprotease-like protein